MGKKLLAAVFGATVTTALIGGVALSGGLGDSGSASAHTNDNGDATHTACEMGDREGMLAAMHGVLTEEGYEAMVEHMAEMHSSDGDRGDGGATMGDLHPEDTEHPHQDDMHRDDLDQPHGMMGGGMMGGPVR